MSESFIVTFRISQEEFDQAITICHSTQVRARSNSDAVKSALSQLLAFAVMNKVVPRKIDIATAKMARDYVFHRETRENRLREVAIARERLAVLRKQEELTDEAMKEMNKLRDFISPMDEPPEGWEPE